MSQAIEQTLSNIGSWVSDCGNHFASCVENNLPCSQNHVEIISTFSHESTSGSSFVRPAPAVVAIEQALNVPTKSHSPTPRPTTTVQTLHIERKPRTFSPSQSLTQNLIPVSWLDKAGPSHPLQRWKAATPKDEPWNTQSRRVLQSLPTASSSPQSQSARPKSSEGKQHHPRRSREIPQK